MYNTLGLARVGIPKTSWYDLKGIGGFHKWNSLRFWDA